MVCSLSQFYSLLVLLITSQRYGNEMKVRQCSVLRENASLMCPVPLISSEFSGDETVAHRTLFRVKLECQECPQMFKSE